MTETTVAKVSKHQLRTRETRARLLEAAEKIFVRDGYEGADLGEIASLAGRTKGAIYGQFKCKEEVFFALVEDRNLRHKARMERLLAESTSVEGNIAAFRKFSFELAKDQAYALLVLEFKLFAIRHPESAERLHDFYAGMFSQERRYADLLGFAGKGKEALSRVAAVMTLIAMLHALVLEAKMEPAAFGEDVIRKVTCRIFDALLQPPSQRSG